MAKPTRVTVMPFQVGFGDCFLLRFQYPTEYRHVLIDFGSYPKPPWATGKGSMTKIAEAIRTECGGKLHAVVATHRHADHISGFATNVKDDDSGSVIASCQPDLVVQPWTEDPDAKPDARKPTAAFMGVVAGRADDEQQRAFRRGAAYVDDLAAMEQLTPIVERESRALQEAGVHQLAADLQFHGQNNLSNLSAVKNLMGMGAYGKARYVFFGADSGLGDVLPGVKVSVLGPPTLEQSDEIKSQTSTHEEFWHLQALAVRRMAEGKAGLFAEEEPADWSTAPPHARWLIKRLRTLRGRQLLEIVRSMDKALNNTSVILLFEVGGKKLLFPGDAQIENWAFALSKASIRRKLKAVDFYKVGHHGSLNATPKSLWNSFAKQDKGLETAVSTLKGVHGHVDRKTEVPRKTLVSALKKHSHFTTTEKLEKKLGAFGSIAIEL